MNLLDKYINEKGVTLVELLVVLAISGIVLSTIYGVFLTGTNLYKKIGIESQIRDEADYILASVLNEFYAIAPNELKLKDNRLSLTSYETMKVNEKDLFWQDASDKIIHAKSDIIIQNEDTGYELSIVEYVKDEIIERKIVNEPYTLFTVSDNGIEKPILDFQCTLYEKDTCIGGTVTLQFAISNNNFSNPDNRMYVAPIEFYSRFGF